MYRFFLISVLILFSSCNASFDFSKFCDVNLFRFFGITFFEESVDVSLKEIHLQFPLFVGRTVSVEATIKELGEFDTYFIAEDKNATLLVVLTGLNTNLNIDTLKGKKLKVLGQVENNRMGLPFLKASSINIF